MKLILGDSLHKLKDLPTATVDAVVTDPPAGISFMQKSWDSDKGGRDQWIAWLEEIMRECFRVMKPGAHAFVWAIPRTSHWAGTAIENAGFEIRDIVTHHFGSGFPKSLDVSKAIDKAEGVKRKDLGASPFANKGRSSTHNSMSGEMTDSANERITAPATDAAKLWQGWGTALKPASEHWILARKPLSEKTVAKNVILHGTGALNIDGSRIGYQSEADMASATPQGKVTSKKPEDGYAKTAGIESERHEIDRPELKGRWPANVIFDEEAAAGLDESVGSIRSRHGTKRQGQTGGGTGNAYVMRKSDISVSEKVVDPTQNGFLGGPSRYFYVAKASTREREGSKHPTIKPEKLMRYLVKLICPPGGICLDPFMGSGTTGIACVKEGFQFIGIEREEEYFTDAKRRIAHAQQSAPEQTSLDLDSGA